MIIDQGNSGFGGAVTAPHHLAAQAGGRVLTDGGNAIEAMIAKGVDLDKPNDEGKSPRAYAEELGEEKVLGSVGVKKPPPKTN
mgnify:CR=1 FL=1